MKKRKLAVVLCACAVMLTSCGNSSGNSGEGHNYESALIGNPQSLDPQVFSGDPSSATVIKNLYSGLFTTDADGNTVPCNVESYSVSEDGTAYTFSLRHDNYWFFDQNEDDFIGDDEYFPVTADDYVFALQRVLNPEMKSPYAHNFSCIKGAKAIIDGEAPVNSAEIYATDNYTLVIVLENKNAEFLNLLSTPPALPCNRSFFFSTKGRYGLDDKSVMSNGAFYVRQWFYDPYGSNNILYMKKNEPNVSENFEIAPSYLSFSIEDSEESVKTLFMQDSAECMTSLDPSLYNSEKCVTKSVNSVTLGLIFNPEKPLSSDDMRKAFALSVDRNSISEIVDSEDLSPARGIIPQGIKINGKSYRTMSPDSQFEYYDMPTASNLFKSADPPKDEEIKILVNAKTINSVYLQPLVEHWESVSGMNLGIEDVTPTQFSQRISDGDYTIALYPLTADFASGLSFIEKFENTPCLKNKFSDAGLSDTLMSCANDDELAVKYAEAEELLLSDYRFIPIFYKNSYLIFKSGNENISYDAFSGAVDYRLALNYN